MKPYFVELKEKDSDKIHFVNTSDIQTFTDYELWIGGRRFKVMETAKEIRKKIDMEYDKSVTSPIV